MQIKARFLIFFLVLFSNITWGQNPFYYKIDKSKGLPSNTIYDIFQDSKGFMWLVTNQGITRYDGKKFLLYTNDNQTSKSGSNLKEDKYGRIWYSNFDGYLYYVEDGQLKSLNNTNSIGFVKFGIVDNYLLVLTKNNILVFNLKNLKVVKKIPFNTENLIATHNSNNLFYLVAENLTIIDKNLSKKSIPLPKEIAQNFPAPLFQDGPEGLIFVSKYAKHFYIFNKKKFIKKEIQGKYNFIQNLAYDHQTNWICTTQGVIRYHENEINTKNTLFNDFNISYVFKDKYQNYWFSTIKDGLLLVPSLSNSFIPFDKKPNVITLSHKQLFVGTTNDKIYKTDLNFRFLNKIFDGGTNHEVYFLTSDSLNKRILFTSNAFKTCDFNARNSTEHILSTKDAQQIDQTYFAFAASGVCGFYKISNEKSKWDKFVEKNAIPNSSKNNLYEIINGVQGKSTTYNPANQTVYYATSSGLFAISQDKKIELKKNNKSLYFSKIKCVNNMIVGLTTNDLLYRISKQNTIELFDTSKFTNGEKVIKFKIVQDYLYVFTPYSIYEYHLKSRKSKKIISLNQEFEISDIDRNQSKIILVNNNGFLLLDSNNSPIANPPKFIINWVEVNGIKRSKKQLEHLPFNENNIKINFSILSYIPNQNNQLYYKINSEKWELADDDSRNFKFNALAPGSYTIYFQTVLDNKKSEIIPIRIKINKPFWLTPFFISIVVLLCLTIIIFIYQWQIDKIQKRNQLLLDKINLEKNVNQSKLKAIKSQMNPHFFYNALNTLQSFILSNEKRMAIEYLSKFSNLTRVILEMTEKDFISLAEEVKTLQLYLDIERGRFDEEFTYEIHIDQNIDKESIKIPTMLLQPHLENAVKHGLLHKKGDKKVKISFSCINNELQINIDDNGIGRQKSSELNQIKNKNHQSFATTALQNRIDLLNSYNQNNISLEITDKYNLQNQPTGTLVKISIPLESL